MIIDTHCHLELNDNDKIEKMKNNIMIVSGADTLSNKNNLNFKLDNIYVTLGLHPDEAQKYTKEDIDFIEKHINDRHVVAIGEIGLDYHNEVNQKLQKELFIEQLEIAKKYKKTVVIHSRDAIKDTLDILKDYKELKKVLHCFSSSSEMAKEFIKINSKIGIGGVVTFKNGKNMQNVVKEIDIEDILLETDSPFLSPEPFRGKENEPYNVNIVANKVASIKNMTVEEIDNITTRTAISWFDLDIEV